MTTGGVVSTSVTVTWKEALPGLPCASVAVQVTVVVPTGKFAPEAGEQDGVMGPSMLSVADALKVTLFPEATVVVVVMSEGTATVGLVVSWTVTWKVALPGFPCVSVALQVTVVVPIPKVDPEPGEHEGVTLPSTASFAEAEKVTAAPLLDVASCVMFAGTVTEGGVVSLIVIVNVPVPVSPPAFVALHVTVVVPSGKTSPELWSHVGLRPWSLVAGGKLTLAPLPEVASTVILGGGVTMGTSADTGAASKATATSDASANPAKRLL